MAFKPFIRPNLGYSYTGERSVNSLNFPPRGDQTGFEGRNVYLYHRIIFIPTQQRPLHPVRALEIRPNAITRRLDLRLLLKHNTPDRMQRDRIPHKLQAMLIPLLGLCLLAQEIPRRVRAVDFEALVLGDDVGVRGVADGEAEVVHDCGDGVGFAVAGGEGFVGDDEAQEELFLR